MPTCTARMLTLYRRQIPSPPPTPPPPLPLSLALAACLYQSFCAPFFHSSASARPLPGGLPLHRPPPYPPLLFPLHLLLPAPEFPFLAFSLPSHESPLPPPDSGVVLRRIARD